MSGLATATPGGARAGAATLSRFGRHVPRWIVVGIVAIVALLAVFGPLIAPMNPKQTHLDAVWASPSAEYLLGTDGLGRDILSRTIVGARTAVVGAVAITVGGLLIGGALGLWAGYRGGRVDAVIMRWVDFMFAVPGLLVAIVVVGVLGGGYWTAVAILIPLQAPFDTRFVRGATLEQRNLPYVESARTLGLGAPTLMRRHIWPNLLPVVIPNAVLTFTYALVGLASLSFLGIGVPPGDADWGQMVAENRVMLFDHPWATLAPALMLMLTATSVSFLGGILFEAMSDRGSGNE